MENISSMLLGVLLFIVVVFFLGWQLFRPRQILNRWAQDNNYEILEADYRWFRYGPFFWTTSKGQCVYYVTVRTPDGQERRGWVRCGGWILGVFSDNAEVRWDE